MINKIARNWAKAAEKLRIVGSFCLVLGYILVIYDNDNVGLPIRITGNLAMMPFALKLKMYDVFLMQLLFGSVTLVAWMQHISQYA